MILSYTFTDYNIKSTVNISYLASTIFGGKWFFNKLAWI